MTQTVQNHFDFFVRCILFFVIMLCRQLPQSYNVHIDKDRFLSSFRAEQEDGTVVPSAWPLGPDGAVHQEQDPHSARGKAHYRYTDEFYPHTARAQPRASNQFKKPAKKAGRRMRHVYSYETQC